MSIKPWVVFRIRPPDLVLLLIAAGFSIYGAMRWHYSREVQGLSRIARPATTPPHPAEVSRPTPRVAAQPTPNQPIFGRQSPPWAFFRSNPRFKEKYLQAYDALFFIKYAPFIKSASLSRGDVQKFKDIMEKDIYENINAQTGAFEEGAAASDPTLDDQRIKNRERELRELFGDDAYSAYRQFRQETDARSEVENLNTMLFKTDDQLSTMQADQLRSIIAASPIPFSNAILVGTDSTDADFEALRMAAMKILSPSQFAVFDTQIAVRQAEADRTQAVVEAMAKTGVK